MPAGRIRRCIRCQPGERQGKRNAGQRKEDVEHLAPGKIRSKWLEGRGRVVDRLVRAGSLPIDPPADGVQPLLGGDRIAG